MPYCFSMISRLSGLLLTLVVSQGLCFVPSPLRATRRIIRMAAENEVPEEVTRVRISSPRGDESLPTNYARNFPHWVAQGGELIRIPKPDSDEGFVEPSSFSEVWLPVDLPSPEARLGLCFVLKDGAPRYILPALDLYVREEGDPPGPAWRNRGLNSVAMARAWLPFDIDVLESATLSVLHSDASATRIDDVPAWTVTVDQAPIRSAIEAMVQVLASGPPQLASGFLYLTVAMDVKLPTPSAGGRCRVYLSPRGASDLLGVGTGIDSETGLLDVRWVEVAAGGESEFLPAAYRPLYRVL